MKKITDAVRAVKLINRGAACFLDPETNQRFCQNGLTHQEAQQIADQTKVTLLNWNVGKTCSQVKC